jgi:fibronectin-binding autotransporter adhesin
MQWNTIASKRDLKKYVQALYYFSIFSASSSLSAGVFDVTNTADSGPGSFRQAILDANANGANSTITFTLGGTINLASSLPALNGNTTTIGTGANVVIVDGQSLYSGLFYQPASGTTLAISGNLTFSDMLSIGGAGGSGAGNGAGGAMGAGAGLFVSHGTVSITGLTFMNCQATGGAGGNATAVGNTGGGGGGMNAHPGGPPSPTVGGNGGNGFGAGGAGGTSGVAGAPGTSTAGGGGGGANAVGGMSAFGGGGGGGGSSANGGVSGFGGGSGGGLGAVTQGFGGGFGGSGGSSGNGGGGGGGLGGAIFIQNLATLQVTDPFTITGNGVTAGAAGTNTSPGGAGVVGKALSPDIFMMSGASLEFNNTGTITIASNINSDQGLGGGSGPGLFMFGSGTLVLSGTNTYSGGTFINSGVIQVSSDASLGSTVVSTPIDINGGTLSIVAPGPFVSVRTVDLTGPATISVANGISATFSGLIQSAGALTVDGLGTMIIAAGVTPNTFSGPITINSGAELQINTSTSLSATLTTVVDNGSFVFNQPTNYVLTANVSGSGTLEMSGAGILELQGTNTYSGSTTISAGTMQFDTVSSFPPANTSAVNLDGTLIFNQPSGTITVQGPISGTGALTMQGGASAILDLSGNNSYTGVTTITSGTLQIDAADSFPSLNTAGVINNSAFLFNNPTGVAVVIGPISGPGTLTMQGAGTVALAAVSAFPNTYTGTTTVNAGTLRIDTIFSVPTGAGVVVNPSGTLAFNNPASTVALISGDITGGGAFVMEGAGTVELSGTNSYGSMTIMSGTVQLDETDSLPSGIDVLDNGILALNFTGTVTFSNNITGTGAVNLVDSGIVTLTGTNTYSGGTGISGGGTMIGTDLGTGGVSFNNGTWSIPSPLTSSIPIDFIGPGLGTININGNAVTFTGVVDGSGPFSIIGGGTLTLTTATNTFTGSGAIDVATTLQITNAASFPSSNSASWDNEGALLFNYASGTASVAASIGGGGSLTLQGGGNLALSGINTYTGTTTISAGTLQVNSSTGIPTLSDVVDNGILDFNFSTGTATISGLISGSGPVNMTSSGTLALTNASNSYAGGTSISGNGVVAITDDGQLGVATTGVTFNNGTLDITTGPVTSNRAFLLNGPGTIEVDLGTATLGATSSITGPGSFTKAGIGTLVLQGTNSYSGTTSIAQGILQVDDVASWSTSSTQVIDNGILSFNQTGTLTVPQQITGGGSVEVINTGTLILSFPGNSYSGGTTVSGGGTIQATADSELGSTAGSLTFNNGTLDIPVGTLSYSSVRTIMLSGAAIFSIDDPSGVATFSGSIVGSSSLTKIGPGTMVLAGNNSGYTGNTTISAGTLQINNGNSYQSDGTVTNNGSFVFNNSSGTATIGGVMSGSGSLIKNASGALIISAANPLFVGPTTVNGGSLTLTGAGSLGSTVVNVGSLGTLNDDTGGLSTGATLTNAGTVNLPTTQTIGALINSGKLNGTGTLTAATYALNNLSVINANLGTGVITSNGTVALNGTTGAATINIVTGTMTLGSSGRLLSLPGVDISGGASLVLGGNETIGVLSGAGGISLGTNQLSVNSGTFSGIISGSVSSELIKTSAGTLTLTGANTYLGITQVNAGTLTLDVGGSMLSTVVNIAAGATMQDLSGGLAVATALSVSGTFDLGANQTIAMLNGPSTGIVNLNAGVLSVGSGTFDGSIAGAGGLTKVTSGTLNLGGANSYSGPTTITTGTLLTSVQDGLSPNSTVTDNATLAFGNSVPITVPNNISGTGSLVVEGTSTVILTGVNTGLTGTTTIFPGATLQVNNTGSLPASSQVVDNGILSLNFTGTNTLNGVITGSGSVQLINSGTLILGGANTYSGGTLISGGGTIQGLNLGTGPITFNNGTWDITSNYTSLTQPIILTGPGTINVDSPNIVTLGGISGTGAFTKDGTGILNLEGANSFGPLTINAGTLEFDISVASILTSMITNNGILIFNNSALVQMQGNIVGSGSLIKEGSATLELSGTNTYTGQTTISAGTLQIDNFDSLPSATPITDNGILNFNFTGTNTFSGLIQGTGSVNMINSGVLALSNVGNTYSGGTGISGGGTIQWSADGEFGAPSGSVTLNNGTLDIIGGISSSVRPFILLGSGPNTIDTNANTVTISGNISGSGPLTKAGSGTLILQGSNSFGSPANPITISAGTLQFDTAPSFPVSTSIIDNGVLVFNQSASTINVTGNISGTGDLTMQGTGVLFLLGNNTYTGLTTVSNGTIEVASSTGIPSGSNINLITPGILEFINSGTATISGMISGNGNLTMAGTGTLILSGDNSGFTGTTSILSGTLQINNTLSLSASEDILDNGSLVFNYTGSDIITGLIHGTGSVQLISNGTLLLANTGNSYSGGTSVSGGGILQVQSDLQLGAPTGRLTLNNGTVQALNTLTMSRPIVLAGLGNFDTNSFNLTLAGNISGSGPLTKVGTGTLIISGTNSFTGPLNINTGTVNIASNGGLPSTTNVTNNGTLLFTQPGVAQVNGVISGPGPLTMAGSGDLVLGGVNTYTGLTTVQTGTLTIDGSVTSNVFVAVGATLGGTGTIFGNVTIDGSSAPGNSIGTITSNTLLFNAGSSYDLEFDNTTADLMIATTSAVIDGGRVVLMPLGFTAPQVSAYPIIESPSVTVNSPFTLVNPLPHFSFSLQYTPTAVLLVPGAPIPFHVIVPTGTGGVVAKCFDVLTQQKPTSVASIVNILNFQTASQLVKSFDQMQPSNFNNVAYAQENVAERIRQIYTNHFFDQRANACPERQAYRVWMTPFVERVRQHGDSRGHGYSETFAGFSAAFDYRTAKQWMITTGFSFAAARMHVPHESTKADFATYAGSFGVAWTPASWFFDLLASYLYSPIHAQRKMDFSSDFTSSTELTAKHSQHTNQYLGHFGTGYLFKIKASRKSTVNIYPFANVDYQYLPQEGYTEHGAHSLDLKVSSKTYDYLRPEGGLGLGYKGCFENLEVAFDLSASYIHEFRFAGKETRSSFDGVSCGITTKGIMPENNLVSPEARLRLASSKNGFSFTLGYHGEFGRHFSMNAAETEFRIAF